MAWRKNDPSLGNDPSYLEPRITRNGIDIKEILDSEKVSSVNGQTGAVQLSIPSKTSELINDDGFIKISSVTKNQVGLGNVQNYGVATQVEAEAGTASTKYMTPQRTKQAIDKIVVSLKNNVTEHLSETISSNHRVTRSVNFVGVHTINTLPNKIPKYIRFTAYIHGTNIASFGSWSENGGNKAVAAINGVFGQSVSVIDISSNISIGCYATLKEVRNGSFDLEWILSNGGYAGTGIISIDIDIIYHGEE